MNSITKKRGLGKIKVIDKKRALNELRQLGGINDMDIKISLIQALIPVGLEKVKDILQSEVTRLAGEPRKHGKINTRWGSQGGSVYLLDQKVPIDVPRARNKELNSEVILETYQKLQEPHKLDEQLFLRLLNGLSTHKYKESVQLTPEVFGLSASSASKRFRIWSKKYLEKLTNRSLSVFDFSAIFIDGKRYAKDGIVIALGVTLDGKKIIIGMEQMNTENSKSVSQFLDKLIERGLKYEEGLLFIVDGSKGVIKAIEDKFKNNSAIQRCQQHKKENVVSYLQPDLQKLYRIKLSQAYTQENYTEAKKALNNIYAELNNINPSAASSLAEGMEDTLTLHRLGLNKELKKSFSSTNCIESLMSQLGQYTDKVDYWRNGRHIQEWTASGLLRIEPNLKKVYGWRHMKLLRDRIRQDIDKRNKKQENNKPELMTITV